MDLAALSTARLFCNIAENKLLATWPGLAPPISFKSWFICSAAVSRVGIERHDHRGGGNHGKVPPGGLAQFKAKMWPSNEMMDSVHGFLCDVICLDQLVLMDGFWSLRNIWPAAESCQVITSYHSFVSWWKEYQSSVHSPQLQRQCCWFKVKRMVPAPVFLSMWKMMTISLSEDPLIISPALIFAKRNCTRCYNLKHVLSGYLDNQMQILQNFLEPNK